MIPSEFWGKGEDESKNVTTPSFAFTCASQMCHDANGFRCLGLRCSRLVLVYASDPRMPLPLGDHQGSSKLISSDPDRIMSTEPCTCVTLGIKGPKVSDFTLILQFAT